MRRFEWMFLVCSGTATRIMGAEHALCRSARSKPDLPFCSGRSGWVYIASERPLPVALLTSWRPCSVVSLPGLQAIIMDDVRNWMISHDLGKYVDTMVANEVDDMETLYAITDADLQAMGIVSVGARYKFFRGVAKDRGAQESLNTQSVAEAQCAGYSAPAQAPATQCAGAIHAPIHHHGPQALDHRPASVNNHLPSPTRRHNAGSKTRPASGHKIRPGSGAQNRPSSALNGSPGSGAKREAHSRPDSRQSALPPRFLDPAVKNDPIDAVVQSTAKPHLADLPATSVKPGAHGPARPPSASTTPPARLPSLPDHGIIECPRHIESILQEWERVPEASPQHFYDSSCTPSNAEKAARDKAAQRHFVVAAEKERARLEYHSRETEKMLEGGGRLAGGDFLHVLRDTMASSKLSEDWHDNLYGRHSPPRSRPASSLAAPLSRDRTPNRLGQRAAAGADLPPVPAQSTEGLDFKAPKEHSTQIRAELLKGRPNYTHLLEHQREEQDRAKESEEKYKAMLHEHFLQEQAAWTNLKTLTGMPDTPMRRPKSSPIQRPSGL